MIRALFRLVLLLVVLFAAGAFLFGWWPGGGWLKDSTGRPIGTTGRIDTTKAREVGAEVAGKAASAASKAETAIAEGGVTAKIKAKMALDDKVRARDINVDFERGVVTLSGVVSNDMERKRAVTLARETDGVTSVNDRLRIAGR
jgi:hyperosmotically inducible protein